MKRQKKSPNSITNQFPSTSLASIVQAPQSSSLFSPAYDSVIIAPDVRFTIRVTSMKFLLVTSVDKVVKMVIRVYTSYDLRILYLVSPKYLSRQR
jgi:hypothetical protein